MEQEDIELSNDDPAAEAFTKLRREVGLMRLAVEKLADEPAKIEIPDYSVTLQEMTKQIANLATSLRSMRDSPALELTPDDIAGQIRAARHEAQATNRAAFDKVVAALDSTSRNLGVYLESARTANQQNKWMLGFGCLGFLAGGTVAWAIF